MIAGKDVGVHPHPRATRNMESGNFTRARGKISFRVFRIDAALYGRSLNFHLILSEAQALPPRNSNLSLDQIFSSNHFCHRMLHLNTGIYFHEIKLHILIQEKLYCPRPCIAQFLSNLYRHSPHLLTHRLIQTRGRGFLNELLIPPLNGTVSLFQMDNCSKFIGQDLKFNMLSPLQIFLHIKIWFSKGYFGLLPG